MSNLIFWLYVIPTLIILTLKFCSIAFGPKVEQGRTITSVIFWASMDAIVPVFNLFYLAGLIAKTIRFAAHRN